MKTLIPALFLALAGSAHASASTICQASSENAFPIEEVTLVWGENLPESSNERFFGSWSQKVHVTISGPRYYQTYDAVAFHSSHNTRLGEERSTNVKLSEQKRVYMQEYPEHFHTTPPRRKHAGLVLHEGTPLQKNIRLDCQ